MRRAWKSGSIASELANAAFIKPEFMSLLEK
jgi:hypothetical protein